MAQIKPGSRVPEYIACAARGLTQSETARELGVSLSAVSAAAKTHGISFCISTLKKGAAWQGLWDRVPRPTAKAAAAELGVSTDAAYKFAEKRGGAWAPKNARPLAPERAAPTGPAKPAPRATPCAASPRLRFSCSPDAIARFDARRVARGAAE